MAARRRTVKTRDLPPNLYVRKGYYSYRDPRTGNEYGLGRDKRIAINQAAEANMMLMPQETSVRLIDRIEGKEQVIFDRLIDNFREEILTRNLSNETLTRHNNRLRLISEYFSGLCVDKITVKTIYEFLEIKSKNGKFAIANQLRSLLSDIFKSAIATGLASDNPVAATRPFRHQVTRSRLTVDEYIAIRKCADGWFGACLDLAVVTGQREGDLTMMRWSDIHDGKLHIRQGKTRTLLRIDLNVGIDSLGLTLSTTLDELKRMNGSTDFVLGGKTPKTIASYFRKTREQANIDWKDKSPAPFHEVRSVAGRLYTQERGKEFAQNILGHKSMVMTEKYIDGRGKEWKDIE